ncbi:MAG: ribonuclease Y [Mariniblastus sp.]|nr:ribonuclease Y [Mariniblastus sp.]
MESTSLIVGAAGGLILGGGLVFFYLFLAGKDAKSKAKSVMDDAMREIEGNRKEAELQIKEETLNRKAQAEQEINQKQQKLNEQERLLDKREAQASQLSQDLEKQSGIIESSQNRLKIKLDQATQRENDLNEIFDKQRKQLQQITGLSKEDATARLLKLLEDELGEEVGSRLLEHERMITEMSEVKSREILLMTMQRFAASQTAESTTSTVDIPNDDMKGRIIGREGRNIRAFEKETGVDVIIDDTPGVVIVSGFDPVRREIARIALDKLINDGRIHPTRIEEVVAETGKEMKEFIRKKGLEAAEEVNVKRLHKRVIEMLGRLHFRTSYSQNVLRHSVEVAFLSGMVAELVGLDGDLARRAGLLHDIGKAADHEREGGHPKIGAEILKRHGEGPEVVHAALGHHDEIVVEHPYTVVVATGDACSASRPGARRESLDRYIKRMEELESIALELKGVTQAFAVQAGREVRVIVSSKEADDGRAAKICRDIANAYEEQLTYPGEVKVTVIRESRFTELAK